MGKKVRIRHREAWIGYPGSTHQNTYAEELEHGFYYWQIEPEARRHTLDWKLLPNPNPFVTLDWAGNVDDTLQTAVNWPKGTRYRIRNNLPLLQGDINRLILELKENRGALEITFKIDDAAIQQGSLKVGGQSFEKSDLRNSEVLVEMMREYYVNEEITDETWGRVGDLTRNYLLNVTHDDLVRNSKWRLKKLSWDNMYVYGEGNSINFDSMSGITGILGANRTGKSSIIGVILYSLFNASDRGSIKNLHLINSSRDYCKATALIEVNGQEYRLDRQTVRQENRNGPHGVTHLNMCRVFSDGTEGDLNGEQRNDTDKAIRNLIGTKEDFLTTCVSTQDEMKRFIKDGSSSRQKLLTRFLDLDILERLHEIANNDVKSTKAVIKGFTYADWPALITLKHIGIAEGLKKIEVLENEIISARSKERKLTEDLHKFLDRIQPQSSPEILETLRSQIAIIARCQETRDSRLTELRTAEIDLKVKVDRITSSLAGVNIDELKIRLRHQKDMEMSILKLRHSLEAEKHILAFQRKSVLKLLEVPCGDLFPTCKFIADSHHDRTLIAGQETKVNQLLEDLTKIEFSFSELDPKKLESQIKTYETATNLLHSSSTKLSNGQLELLQLDSKISAEAERVALLITHRDELESVLDEAFLSQKLESESACHAVLVHLKSLEAAKMNEAMGNGRLEVEIEKLAADAEKYHSHYEKLKVYELIANAFSKKGIPNRVIHSQLPLINAQINTILNGIVNFSIEFESDEDSNSLEIYINYGDSRRIIELGSGMEKVIASLAIRAALSLVTTLPKSDMFIIDEGFSDLDETQVETCNRMIRSLKTYFKNTIIITHVEGIKDVVDNTIEISRIEHLSKVNHG